MNRFLLTLLLTAVCFGLVPTVITHGCRPETAKVEQIGPFTDNSATEAVKKVLDTKGYRVILSDGALCDIWLRNGIANAKNDVQGVSYTTIAESSFLGVITFPKASIDFRKQGIRAGTYTLRYALHPIDGNHLGISPIRDFILLLPISEDKDPDAKPKFEELTALSKKASGTNHPSPLSLVTTDGITTWPSVIEDENAHMVFAAKMKTLAGSEMPIAFVVKGVVEQ